MDEEDIAYHEELDQRPYAALRQWVPMVLAFVPLATCGGGMVCRPGGAFVFRPAVEHGFELAVVAGLLAILGGILGAFSSKKWLILVVSILAVGCSGVLALDRVTWGPTEATVADGQLWWKSRQAMLNSDSMVDVPNSFLYRCNRANLCTLCQTRSTSRYVGAGHPLPQDGDEVVCD